MNSKKNDNYSSLVIFYMLILYPAIQGPIWYVCTIPFRFIGLNITVELLSSIFWIFVILYCINRKYFFEFPKYSIVLYLGLVAFSVFCYGYYHYKSFDLSVLLILIFSYLPLILCGSVFRIDELEIDKVYFVTICTFSLALLYQIYYLSSGRTITTDNMDYSYKILPTVLLLVGIPYLNNSYNLFKTVVSIVAVIFVFMQGTRGPILCLAVFWVMLIIKKHGIMKTTLRASGLILVAALVISSSFFQIQLQNIINKVDSSGASSRVLTMLSSGNITDGNGRDEIQNLLINDIKDHPLKIRGFYSDRQATRGFHNSKYSITTKEGTYAHSILLEIFHNFGVFLGLIIFIYLINQTKHLFIYSNKQAELFCCLFIVCGFVHLFVSDSYLVDRMFFFLNGVFLNYKLNDEVY